MRPWSLPSWVWGRRVALPDTLVLGRFPSPVRQGEIALGTRESGGGMRTQGLGARVTINV
jgi:hypothetical protein